MAREGGGAELKKLSARAITFTLLGAVIGAGFASGQEIEQFFMAYGAFAPWAALVTIMAFLIFCGALTLLCWHKKIYDLADLLVLMAGRRIGAFFLHLLNLFMWFGLTVMLAGSAAVLEEFLYIPRLWGALLTAGLVFFVCRRAIVGLSQANEYLLPLLFFLISFFLLRSLSLPPQGVAVPTFGAGGWFASALLYMGSNSAILLTLLPSIAERAAHRRVVLKGIAGAAILLLALLLTNIFLLGRYAPLIKDQDIPLLAIAKYLLPQLPWLYGLLLLIALLTTAFANGLSLDRYVHRLLPQIGPPVLVGLILSAAILASWAGFRRLIAVLYPFTGYVCLIFYAVSVFYYLISFDSS